jgi:hypothetical protein
VVDCRGTCPGNQSEPPLELTLGQYLLADILPPDVYRPGQEINKQSINTILAQVAERYPDRYKDILHRLTQLGKTVSVQTGGGSFSVSQLATPPGAAARRAELAQKVQKIVTTLPEDKQNKAITDLLFEASKTDKDLTYDEANAAGSPLALMLKGAGRGNRASLNRLIASDLLYSDASGRPVPIPILRSYSQGLSPGEYVASSFGARKGIVDTKLSVGASGYLSKLLNSTAHRMVVTDQDGPPEIDQRSIFRGLPVDTDDEDNVGALLSIPVGGYDRNTVLTPKILADLQRRGIDEIAVRSPITTADPHGGVYARDVGYRSEGRLPENGSSVGITASSVVSEPITQAALCLAKGTLVRMSNYTVKRIEEIVSGDEVVGADKNGKTFPVKVVRVFDNGPRECIESKFSTEYGETAFLISTPEHKVLGVTFESDYLPRAVVREVAKSDVALMPTMGRPPGKQFWWNKDSVTEVGVRHTYDIEVDHPDHLFLLANRLIVSNSSKHKGGLVDSNTEELSGFELIDRLFNTPKDFREAASHATVDGVVDAITPAQQGGHYVSVGGQSHYVPGDKMPSVKVGAKVEAGDQLSNGPPNPREVIAHKGLGEGARQLTYTIRDAIRESGGKVNRRNLELVVRGLVDRVRLTEEYGDYSPDDLVPYNQIAANWKPREGFRTSGLESVQGRYLEEPVLHYSIGTRITPSVVSRLKKHGIKQIATHVTPPPFQSEMVRSIDLLKTDDNFLTRQLGTGLQKSLLDATHRGLEADEDDTSFVASRARAVDFNRKGLVKLPVRGPLPNLGHQ